MVGLIGTAKLNGFDQKFHFRAAPPCIANHPINPIEELTPWNIATNPAEQSLHAA